MSRQIVLEVTQPFHKTGTEVIYQPGEQFPLGTDLPDGVAVREVIAEVPDPPEPEAQAKPAPAAGQNPPPGQAPGQARGQR